MLSNHVIVRRVRIVSNMSLFWVHVTHWGKIWNGCTGSFVLEDHNRCSLKKSCAVKRKEKGLAFS